MSSTGSESDDDLDSDDRSSSSDNDEFEVCRMCNIEVPKAYIKEHMDSIIHKTNIKITEVAINRSKDHFKNDKLWQHRDSKDIVDEFCNTCNVMYDYLESYTHPETEQHKNLTVFQQILPKMYELYKDIDHNLHLIDEIDLIFKKYDAEPIIDRDEVKYCEICDVYKKAYGFDGHLRGPTHRMNCIKQNIQIPNVSNKKNQKYCNVCHVYKSAKDFDSHTKSKKHKKNLRKKDFEALNVEKENIVITITEDHAKYIYDTPYGKRLCLICKTEIGDIKTLIADDKIVQDHLKGVEHLLAYKDCLLNNNIAKVGNIYFCIDCSLLFSDLYEHVRSKHSTVRHVSWNLTYCELCKVKVPTKAESLHKNGARHKEKEIIRRTENITFIDIDLEEVIHKENFTLTITDNQLICSICKVAFDDQCSLVNHFEGLNHKLKLNYYAKDNGMESKNDAYHCNICDIPVKENDILTHITTYTHKSKAGSSK